MPRERLAAVQPVSVPVDGPALDGGDGGGRLARAAVCGPDASRSGMARATSSRLSSALRSGGAGARSGAGASRRAGAAAGRPRRGPCARRRPPVRRSGPVGPYGPVSRRCGPVRRPADPRRRSGVQAGGGGAVAGCRRAIGAHHQAPQTFTDAPAGRVQPGEADQGQGAVPGAVQDPFRAHAEPRHPWPRHPRQRGSTVQGAHQKLERPALMAGRRKGQTGQTGPVRRKADQVVVLGRRGALVSAAPCASCR